MRTRSPREANLTDLGRQGWSNQPIADRLFLGDKTVSNHIDPHLRQARGGRGGPETVGPAQAQIGPAGPIDAPAAPLPSADMARLPTPPTRLGCAGRSNVRGGAPAVGACRQEGGHASVEWAGILAVAVIVVTALLVAAPSLGERLADSVRTGMCAVFDATGTTTECASPSRAPDTTLPTPESREPLARGAALPPELETLADVDGERVTELIEERQRAKNDGDAARVAEIDDDLSAIAAIVEAGGRSDHVEELLTASDEQFDEMVAAETTWDDGHATRYFETDLTGDGDGVVVLDFWIEADQSGHLRGDGRELADDPWAPEVDDSRMLVTIDEQTGRGMATVAETCRAVTPPLMSECKDARTINLDDEGNWDGLSRANNFTVDASEDALSIEWDGLNSISLRATGVAVNGDMELEREDGQWTVTGGERDRYPSLAVYHATDDERELVGAYEEGPFANALPLVGDEDVTQE